MVWKTIRGHHIRMGLQDKTSPSIDAKPRHKIAQTIQPQTKETTPPTIPKRADPIRRKEAM